MPGLDRPSKIQSTIRGYLSSQPSGLTHVPEIENHDLPGTARKLQVQVFALSDALHDATEVINHLKQRVDTLERQLGDTSFRS